MNLEFGNVCLSGGADGADLQFGMCAGRRGHHVFHFSYAGHRTAAPEAEVVVLSEEQLVQADPFLEKANATIERSIPYAKPWIVNLLRRNHYQVRDAEAVYAVSHFEDGKVAGGTAWAVQMFLDRFDKSQAQPCYVFDQCEDRWYAWVGNAFRPLEGDPPAPTGVYAGIGSRKLLATGKTAIRRLAT